MIRTDRQVVIGHWYVQENNSLSGWEAEESLDIATPWIGKISGRRRFIPSLSSSA